MEIMLIALTLILAFANGANDVSKGIATLAGSGVTRFRGAVAWGTLWTAAGAVSAAFASQGLVAAFSGKGLLLQPTQDPRFLVAVAAVAGAEPRVRVDYVENCDPSDGIVAGVRLIDGMHWLTSGLTSFARGMNDTPKVLALGAAMALGSYLSGLRVTRTLAEKVTRIEPEDGFAANLVTALLVAFASRLALPVSTTHVSAGAVIGVGLARGDGSLQWKTIRDMTLAWVVTLPVSAAFAWACYDVASRF